MDRDTAGQFGPTEKGEEACFMPGAQRLQNGPYGYANWRAATHPRMGRILWGVEEFAVHCDVKIGGELSVDGCPYDLISTAPPPWESDPGPFAFPLVMRVQVFLGSSELGVSSFESDDSRYLNVPIEDEIACLLSLLLGRRVRAGQSVRSFRGGGDPLGRPQSTTLPSPFLLSNMRDRSTLPRQRKPSRLGELNPIFFRYPELVPSEAMAVARAARLYRDAISVGEREPELAWLLLVSAVESAAHSWDAAKEESPEDALRRARPGFYEALAEIGPQAVGVAAKELAHTLRATRKFMKFLQAFGPREAPLPRPEYGAIEWSWRKLKSRLQKVYEVRSKTLHSGAAIPHPMCGEVSTGHSPRQRGYRETLDSTGQASAGGAWSRDDIPMLLHVFEHIVRHALTSWWEEMALNSGDAPPDECSAQDAT